MGTGVLKQVKILGVWAMIDDGETDWKILVIDVNDPKAAQINNADDLEKAYPGAIEKTFTFLRYYKIPAGSGPNQFAFDSKLQDAAFAQKVIDETHTFWQGLWKRDDHGVSIMNTTQANAVSADEAKAACKL